MIRNTSEREKKEWGKGSMISFTLNTKKKNTPCIPVAIHHDSTRTLIWINYYYNELSTQYPVIHPPRTHIYHICLNTDTTLHGDETFTIQICCLTGEKIRHQSLKHFFYLIRWFTDSWSYANYSLAFIYIRCWGLQWKKVFFADFWLFNKVCYKIKKIWKPQACCLLASVFTVSQCRVFDCMRLIQYVNLFTPHAVIQCSTIHLWSHILSLLWFPNEVYLYWLILPLLWTL